MNPKEFQALLDQKIFTSSEKDKAWTLYKKESPQKALAFLKTIEDKFGSIRRSLLLHPLPVPYKVWGENYIEAETIAQMDRAARLPVALAGALMPDAHLGYGLPIGGVLATENSVIPYAVGVDIACRMKLTIYPLPAHVLENPTSVEYKNLYSALLNNTVFGAGAAGIHKGKIDHPILEKSHWELSPLIRSLRQTAIYQIGTSGGGNHFVEWGELKIFETENPFKLAAGTYLALLSHSGSRGVGFKIADYYTKMAMAQLRELDHSVKHLAWLPLDHDLGREYWEAMQLAGQFASANHHVIHQRIAEAVGIAPIATVENHHNFAWREKIHVQGKEKEAIVHRKGSTPSGKGVLGIIPGTMADAGYVVVGKGNLDSLSSASHGSGRQMARTKAKKTISLEQHLNSLLKQGIDLIGGGLDESPQAYKPIEAVMKEQKDLVDVIGKFQPKIVRMAAEGSLSSLSSLPQGIVEGE
ncbi:RtcB family protein [Neochlamydia sp. S13]|uniref:RtcB family protein n=1 Tax=Neochlamydia sp. S13 TaxID=1353976 RepID=UPI0005A7B2B8|nr:RtcB family protein [Neochlamydia sp. S13]BBI17847.1 RNA-splicing ligase RtcB [Neochlamydia sp. S13]